MYPATPPIVFIHGALNDHSIWTAQERALSEAGYKVMALDLPGHGDSSPGPALASVEAMADWLLARLDAAGVDKVLLAGHSMGSLIALETADRAPARVAGLALLGTAAPMKVSDALLTAALDDQLGAIAMVAQWSHAPAAPDDDKAAEAAAALEARSRELMQQVADSGPPHLLHTDLAACKAYANGERAAQGLGCPVLFVLGKQDKMTPPRAAKTLTAAAGHGTIVEVDAGHAMMAEQSDAVAGALVAFAAACTPA